MRELTWHLDTVTSNECKELPDLTKAPWTDPKFQFPDTADVNQMLDASYLGPLNAGEAVNIV